MPMNHWLSPYMVETSAKSTATFWAGGGAVLCGQTAAFGFNANNEEEEELLEEPAVTDDSEVNSNTVITTSSGLEHRLSKEPLFEKSLTPSDVGKLNRLVIPKQHAEKYFPLNGGGVCGSAAEPGEKGLLLGFEDEVGKSWRFRYSYWNSSQSYVLTKGWSRFVKEKRLDAGDIVLFARHSKEVGRLFIGWRRRSSGESGVPQPPCGGVLYASHPYPSHQQLSSNSAFHPTDFPHAEEHTRGRNGSSKRLRLFGVNLVEWEEDDSEASTRKTDPYHEYYQSYILRSTNI